MSNINIRINGNNVKSNVVNFAQDEVELSYNKPIQNKVCALTAADVGILDLPVAKVRISNFRSQVRTAEGKAATADIGYTGSAAYFHNDLDINAVAETASSAAEVEIDNTAGDKYITLTPSVAVNVAKIILLYDIRVVDR